MLDGLDEIQICTHYEFNGTLIDTPPLSADEVAQCKPQFISMPGWQDSTFGVKQWQDLPANAQDYLKKIEAITGIPIHIVSTGPERDETILIKHPFELS